jgi:iron(III) transport system permease protein
MTKVDTIAVLSIPPERRRFRIFDSVASIASWTVVAVILIPLLVVVVRLVIDQLESGAITATFSMPGLARTFLNTAIVIVASVLVALVVASILAWLNERTNARIGFITDILPVVPMLVPSIAGAIGWVLLASPTAGFINVAIREVGTALGLPIPSVNIFSWPGLIFVYSIYMVPQIYLTIAAALRNVDPALEEAARTSGAGVLRTLRTVTFPAVKPALFSGVLLALVYGIALFSVPLIIGTQARIDILTVEIVRMLAFTFPPKMSEAVTLSLLVAVVLAVVWAINVRIVKKGHFSTVGGKSTSRRLVTLGPVALVLSRIVMIGYLLIVSVLPLLALLIVSFQGFWSGKVFTPYTLSNYEKIFRPGSQTVEGLVNSISLGLAAATIAMVLAVLIWYRVSHGRSARTGGLIDGITKLPATLSHMVIAVALLVVLGGPPFMLSSTLLILIIAYVVLYIPQASIAAQTANQMIGRDLSEASWVSGAGRGATVRSVVIPLARNGLISGWVFVFILVAGDITASALLASPGTPVVGFLIMSLFQNGSYPLLAALGTVISLASSVVVLTVLGLTNRRRAFER